MGHVTLDLGPKNRPKVWRKRGHTKKNANKYFTRLYISRYPFIPTNPLLLTMIFFLFFPVFVRNIVRSSLKRHNPEKTKLHHICCYDLQTMQIKSTMCKHCKQNSRYSAKKVLVIKLDSPKIWKNRRACLEVS